MGGIVGTIYFLHLSTFTIFFRSHDLVCGDLTYLTLPYCDRELKKATRPDGPALIDLEYPVTDSVSVR